MRKWFGNLKIAYKLLVSFLFVTSLVLVIGAVGIINLSVLVKHQEYLLTNFQTTVTTDNQQNDGTSAATSQSDATSSATITADKVNNDIRNSKTTIYLMSGIVVVSIIISVLLGTYISRLVGEPMKLFAEYAKMLAVGDVEADKALKLKKRNIDGRLLSRKDEFGELAVSFERVIGSTRILAEQTQNIASGDLTTEVTVRSGSDILGQALHKMVIKFHELTTSIIATSEQVSDGAAVVSGSSAALSQGASVQASSIQQLSAAIEEISAQTLTNAQNARTASQLAVEIKNDAETGNQQMHGMLIAMDEIDDASGSISKIIKVIDDIAFQTNILALNAAVEAARAGQHGKGFAVVAEEVRNLAVKSANAANETTKLIQGSIGSVEKGTVIARETAAALDKIVAKVAKAADLIGEIASASEEQAGAIEQFNQGLTQVSQVVQNTVAISEESAAASEELSNQATALKEKTAFYTVDMNRAVGIYDGRLSGQKQKVPALPLHRITLD